MVPGNRVLLRAPNNPMMVAAYLAVMKAGGVVVATMPLLRAKELSYPIDEGARSRSRCATRGLPTRWRRPRRIAPELERIVYWGDGARRARSADGASRATRISTACDTASDDVCLIAFTSGTTGEPKGTMHFHRDMLAICDGYAQARAAAPSRTTASSARRRSPSRSGSAGSCCFRCASARRRCCWKRPAAGRTARRHREISRPPSASRRRPPIAPCSAKLDGPRHFVAAQMRVGRRDAAEGDVRGLARGHRHQDPRRHRRDRDAAHLHRLARERGPRRRDRQGRCRATRRSIIDDDGREVPPGTVGRLAVRGPTGCRYLADARQTKYVQDGWNVTGDTYLMDADGYFWYQARSDDMIISAGYNIAGPEVEAALLTHPAVAECGVVGAPDEERGQIVKAYVVLRAGHDRRRRDDARRCRITSRRPSRRTNIRARSSSSPSCRRRRPASCSASNCAAEPPKASRASSHHRENARAGPTFPRLPERVRQARDAAAARLAEAEGLRQRHQGARRLRVRRRHGRLGREGEVSEGLRRRRRSRRWRTSSRC